MNTAIASGAFRKIAFYCALIPLLGTGFMISICSINPVWAFASLDVGRNSETSMAMAEREVKSGDFVHAAPLLTQILQSDSHAGDDVYRMLAFSQFKLNHSDEALATCEHGLVLYPNSNAIATLYVSIVREVLSPEERRNKLEAIVKQIPDSAILVKTLGEELLALNFLDTRALQLLSSAVTLSPRDAEAHFFYGEAACFNQDHAISAVCVKELRRAHELAPLNEQANMQLYTMIAVAEDTQGDVKPAADDFGQAMRANKTLAHPSPYAAMKFATFLWKQHRDAEALVVINEVLQWDPSYGDAHFGRATLFSDQGKKEDAIGEAELALQDSRSTEDQLRTYHFFLCKTYFAMGKRKDALVHQSWVQSHLEHY